MVRVTQHASAFGSPERTKAYTDGVFAIAATLLVLDLTVDSFGHVERDAQLWHELGAMWPNFISFLISFALLSLLWTIHVRQFRDIVQVDTTLLWLNNARLLCVVLVPFTTSLAAEYGNFQAGRVLLPVNFFLAALLGWLSWVWASARGGHLLAPDVTDARAQGMGGLAASIIGLVVVLASIWLGPVAFLLFLLNDPLSTVLARRASASA